MAADNKGSSSGKLRPVLTVNGIPTSVQRGSVISGIAFGDASFVEAHASNEAAKAALKVSQTATLALVEPHSGIHPPVRLL